MNVVEVWCDYCEETHTPSKTAYKNNTWRNGGEYSCRRRSAHLAAKKRQVNPYASEGKKQCIKCHEVKSFSDFSIRRASWDGVESRCKDCRSKGDLALPVVVPLASDI